MKLSLTLSLLLSLTFTSCKESWSYYNHKVRKMDSKITNEDLMDSTIVYQTENLIIKKLSVHIYKHISYLDTDNFGKVACNGMLVLNENKGIIFDTPTNNKSSQELIDFVTDELESEIMAMIPTHFHEDCIGGIAKFEEYDIQTYCSNQTIKLLKKNGVKLSNPIKSFENKITLNIGSKKVFVEYFGEGHTKDNIITYFPDDNALFGGCLIKELGADRGYIGDANTNEWSKTVEKVKLKYPNAKIVIPGHGHWGGIELLDYTIKLFDPDKFKN